ncbi:MAG: PLP-dependent aminotransferase family protein [Acidaminococcus sp.]|jgi:GntR family transcriptional regulator/MocR family aminotransferase|nr:PLP-dependent aminotransferase family protein [Acidaminococcus sp.]MCI2115139.1 PLP-dependent aminotransferase family protein [Acidaminococcus sp.]MCI2117215.1 PLP-dependent aminotransferase family protein [Acidaminococcus sp.]
MATVFNFFPLPEKGPLYRQLAGYFRNEITDGHFAAGDLLPSIRTLMRDLKMSRTTVENAYELLIDEGYVQNLPSRGYQVAEYHPVNKDEKQQVSDTAIPLSRSIRYNFSNRYVDAAAFDAAIWHRCLNKVLREPEAIAGYGDPQGEERLREVLARYSYEARGVVCHKDQILVGAGLQALLMPVLPLLPVREKRIGFEAPGFPQAEEVARLMGWEPVTFDPGEPQGHWPEVLMISPTNPYKGRSLSKLERNNLIVATQLERVYLLEDDYNGEFRYLHRPVPALHSFGNREQILYVGSFSRILLPSLRISYLVLPEKLLPAYRRVSYLFNQTSSTMEQLALAHYIEEGHLARHVKKLRKRYLEKSALLQAALEAVFGDKARIVRLESGLHLHIALHCQGDAETLARKALDGGVMVMPVRNGKKENPEFLLSFAGIAQEDIRLGVEALKKALEE